MQKERDSRVPPPPREMETVTKEPIRTRRNAGMSVRQSHGMQEHCQKRNMVSRAAEVLGRTCVQELSVQESSQKS